MSASRGIVSSVASHTASLSVMSITFPLPGPAAHASTIDRGDPNLLGREYGCRG